MALISDAGTPLISDPVLNWFVLHKKIIFVVPVPGACAAIAALVLWAYQVTVLVLKVSCLHANLNV
jgi:16S rRNA C1402 (ribose-2'-O) methylase RsmI